MLGRVINWIWPVPVSLGKVLGLGREDTSSAEARAPLKKSSFPKTVNTSQGGSGNGNGKHRRQDSLLIASTGYSKGDKTPPIKSIMNKSQPTSRRESNVALGTLTSLYIERNFAYILDNR